MPRLKIIVAVVVIAFGHVRLLPEVSEKERLLTGIDSIQPWIIWDAVKERGLFWLFLPANFAIAT